MIELIKSSLTEDNFSSHIQHKSEDVFESASKEYKIPDYFNVNGITILPVNPSRFFIYWMLSKDNIEKYKESYPEIKLYVEDVEVLKIKVYNHCGDIYLHYHAPFKKVYAILSINDEFVLKSNEIIAPSDVLSFEDEEIWFDKSINSEKKIPSKLDKKQLEELLKVKELKIVGIKELLIETPSSKR
jgi:hypothetical protein